ncbi:hypothetical protein C0Q70_09486 [Pomacea canaliculata]|uniref:EF-hand domain-containing protein n=1 Tax=Pomacea canaliculata TaxID=400727 RepID=A0A2T7P9X6_POMCA|nr:hypothetical protein C0Q70_09486 [Pomacea canaliculata]
MSHRKPYISVHKHQMRLKKLCRESSLPVDKVRQLIDYFNFVTTNPPGKMPRAQFRAEMTELFTLNDDFMLDNLYRCFDQKNRGYLIMEEYVRGMGMFLSDNLSIKIRLCFQVYDLNGDGFISREEILQWLKGSLVKQSHEDDTDESIKSSSISS